MTENQTEKNIDNRIKEEYDCLKIYFEDLVENKKAVLTPLIQNAAFMRVTLEDLQELIQRDGVVDYYQNGANQSGLKQSAALQSYNALVKNYCGVIKNLFDFLPAMKRPADPFKWKPREKTAADLEEERRLEAEKQARINAECAAAAEKLRREREKAAQKQNVCS